MEISGTVITTLPIQTGQGKNGVWKKQDIILQVGINKKMMCISLWNNLVDETLKQGDTVNASAYIESREYNGRWYTDIKVVQIGREKPIETTPMPLEVYRIDNPYNGKEMAFNQGNLIPDNGDMPF